MELEQHECRQCKVLFCAPDDPNICCFFGRLCPECDAKAAS